MLTYKVLEHNNQNYIFDPANLIIFPADEVLLNSLEMYSQDASVVEKLKKSFPELTDEHATTLVEEIDSMVDSGYLQGKSRIKSPELKAVDVPVRGFNVHVSHVCNLGCRYCYGAQGTYGKDDGLMTEEMGKALIDFLFENAPEEKSYKLSFFGGEPLMNRSCIETMIHYLNERSQKEGKKPNYNMTTNGTIIDEELAELFKKNNLYSLFSLDGAGEVQDYLRPFKDGHGSFGAIKKNMELLKESNRGKAFDCRVTLTHHCTDIEKIYFDLLEEGASTVSFALVSTDQPELEITDEDIKVLKEGFKNIVKKELANVKAGGKRLPADLKRHMNTLHYRRVRRNSCYAGRRKLAVSPDGDLYPCHRFVGIEEWNLGNFKGEIDQEKRQMFFDADVENMSKCKDCWAKSFCGGGCYQIWYIKNGSIYEADEQQCDWFKFVVNLAIETYLELTPEERERIGLKKKINQEQEEDQD